MKNKSFVDDISFLQLEFDGVGDRHKILQMVENLKRLHGIVTSNYNDFDSLINSYLQAGLEMLGLETGIVSHIKDETYTVLAVQTSLDGLEVGLTFPLGETYCNEVYLAERTLAFPHIGMDEKMSKHPVYVAMKLEAYLSAPIYVNNEIYGTINFTSLVPREQGFSIYESELMDLMSRSIGSYLEAMLAQKEIETKSKQLAENNRLLNDLMGRVAHDLRSPLANVLGFSDLLGEYVTDPEGQDILERIKKISNMGIDLIRDLVEFSGVNRFELRIQKSTWAVQEITETVIFNVERWAQKKGINLLVEGDRQMKVSADQLRVSQILSNLLTNAIKFTPKGGDVQLSWWAEDNDICFSVKDSGVGVNPEILEGFSNRTKAASTLGTDGEKGTGYGLLITKELLNAHNSKLEVKTEVGKGSEFRFCLPQS